MVKKILEEILSETGKACKYLINRHDINKHLKRHLLYDTKNIIKKYYHNVYS